MKQTMFEQAFRNSTYRGDRLLARGFVVLALASMPVHAQYSIEEVIITAQKKVESMQDVPISVMAFSERDLDNIVAQDIGDVGAFSPNVELSGGATQPSYSIRGISTSDFGIGADPAVGVYLDGIYIGRSGASKTAFNDIARVEILNGPQGTLFGRNAAAGAVQYITNKPGDEKEGWVKATLGSENKRKMAGVYNLPLSDNLYWRSSLLWNERDGYVDNVFEGGADKFNGEDNWSVNTALAWYPKDELEVIFRMEYDEVDPGASAQSSATLGPRDGHGEYGSNFDKVASDTETTQWRDLFGASLHVDYELENYVISSITAWREYESKHRQEADGSAAQEFRFDTQNKEDNQSFSQEFSITSTSEGPLNFTAGVNYSREDAQQTTSAILSPDAVDKLVVELMIGLPYEALPSGTGFNAVFNTPIAFGGFAGIDRDYAAGAEALTAEEYREDISIDAQYESIAAFGDITYAVTEDLEFTVGLRYTKDEKDFSRYVKFNEFGTGLALISNETRVDENGELARNGDGTLDHFGGTVGWYKQVESWEEVTSRVVVDYKLTSDILTYISYSEGFKSGGFNSSGEIDSPSFDPENVENWEVGFKTAWLDNTLQVNGAFFMYDYLNLQKLELVPGECTTGGSGVSTDSYQFETSDVEGKGFELSTVWVPVSGLTVSLNTGTLDAEYTRRDKRSAVDGQCHTEDDKGETFNESPDLNYSLGINYAHILGSGAELNFNAAYTYKDGFERDSCRMVVENVDGSVSVHDFGTVDGEFRRTGGGAGQSAPDIDGCSDSPDSQLLNLRVAYIAASGDWELSTYMTNATDEHGNVQDPAGLGGSLASQITDGSPTYTRRDPRMYGVEFKHVF